MKQKKIPVAEYIEIAKTLSPYIENLDLPYTIVHSAIRLDGGLVQPGDLEAIKTAVENKGGKIKIKGDSRKSIEVIDDVIDYFSILLDQSDIIEIEMRPGFLLFYPTIPEGSILKIPITEKGIKIVEKMLVEMY